VAPLGSHPPTDEKRWLHRVTIPVHIRISVSLFHQ